jgi:L-ascorbate oxidase
MSHGSKGMLAGKSAPDGRMSVTRVARPIGAAILGVALIFSTWALADDIVEPAVYSSESGMLDILLIAKPKPVPTIKYLPSSGGAGINPIAWVYEVCKRPADGNACPANAETVSDYGGVRLALRAGDVLKIRLVNQLPALDSAKLKHASEPGHGNLFRNPTNLHTHGLIVPPRAPTRADPTFGDYVFLEVYNSANGMPMWKGKEHPHSLVKMDFADYRIDISANHPSGVFWFHPHIHGLSLNQVSSGLAGIISVGDPKDYLATAFGTVRHLILKDMQVLAAGSVQYGDRNVTVADGEVQNQQTGEFCEARDNGGPDARLGFCDGGPGDGANGQSFVGSRWYFTINGQVFPTIHVTSPKGEIWRIINASAQLSYRLGLIDDSSNSPMAVQLIAIDGLTIDVPAGTPPNTVMMVGGNKFTVVDCPASDAKASPTCVRDLVMMPSARAEVWVTYRGADGSVIKPSQNASATLKQQLVDLGRASERWPQFKLAKIQFDQPDASLSAVELSHFPDATARAGPSAAARISSIAAPTQCAPLAQGHRRRIFFGVDNPDNQNPKFGIGYEEVDQKGAVVKQLPVSAFDPADTIVCLPLGVGDAAVHETWEIVNLSEETHNFHIHQTRFRLLDSKTSRAADATKIEEDNVPLPYGKASVPDKQNGYCTIKQWHSGQCVSQPVVLDIPFSQRGDFVMHCHILEHEDGGMMAKIRVVAHP